PPLGLRRALSLGFAETHLAPLHLDLVTLETYVTTGLVASTALAIGRPALPLVSKRPVASVAASLGTRIQGAPSREGRWTVLAEARSGTRWRNVALSGRDVYGLTAELLAWGSMSLVGSSPRRHGVLSPVAAFGTEPLTHELKRNDVAFAFYEPSHAT
ncbi:MAG: hypothetical protein H0U16_10595, partial [Actinobacteria bacterium]|nr:hypothetical protein [Actinomycetota bacterium]